LYIGVFRAWCVGVVSRKPSRWPAVLKNVQSASGPAADLDLQQFAADIEKIVHRHLGPAFDADAGAGAVVIAERDIGFRLTAQHGAGHWLAGLVEYLDERIEVRPEPAGMDFDNQPLALFGVE